MAVLLAIGIAMAEGEVLVDLAIHDPSLPAHVAVLAGLTVAAWAWILGERQE